MKNGYHLALGLVTESHVMKRILLVAWLGICALHCATGQAVTLECPRQPWLVALYDNGLVDSQGKTGIDAELIDEIARRSGCKFKRILLPRARIWHQLEHGGLDLSVAAIESAQRKKFGWFIHYLQMKNLVLLDPNLPTDIVTARDFLQQPQLQFGAIRSYRHGFFHDRFLQQLGARKRLQYYPDIHTLFLAFSLRRVHGIFSQPPVYRRLLAETAVSPAVRVLDWAPEETPVPHGLVLAKHSFSLAQARQFQQLINELRDDGTLLRIFQNHLPADEAAGLVTTAAALAAWTRPQN